MPPIDTQPAGWRDLTTGGLAVSSLRWRGDSALTYTGTNGKEPYGSFSVALSGTRTRLGRRNGSSPSVDLPDGSTLFSQLERTSPYEERSDLFVQRGNRQFRLTTNGRLFSPDARSNGDIIATQIIAGASRLVRVSPDGGLITALTVGSFDTLWSEPRWSHSGTRVAAVRWFRGGVSQIVVLDTLGAVRHVVTSGRFTAATPSWIPGDSGVAYTTGDGGRNDLYLQYFDQSYRAVTYKLLRSDLGGFEPQLVRSRSSNQTVVAATALRANGYRLGVAEGPLVRAEVQPMLDDTPDPRLPPLAVDSSPASTYSAWSSLVPRYWAPLIEAGIEPNTLRLGGYTEGWDILHRHYVYGELRIPTDNSGIESFVEYQYKGLGLPVVTAAASQGWSHYADIVSSKAPNPVLGSVRRRIKDGQFLATYLRPRVRTSFTLSAGVGLERREYLSVPDTLLPRLDTGKNFGRADFPRLMVSSSFAAYQTAPFSISPEDGFSVAATVRERLHSGFNAAGGASMSAVGTINTYKSLDLPGYAHHVLAVRASGGWADTRTSSYFEVGGTSGGSFQVLPGYTIGEGSHTFPVRGFEAGTLIGVRALAGSAEYRAPLSLTHRSLGLVPGFLNRSSLTLFGDYGVAWCPSTALNRQVCTAPKLESHIDIGSVGAELNVNAGVLSWDAPYRFRLGIAVPIRDRITVGAKAFTVYLTSGLSF